MRLKRTGTIEGIVAWRVQNLLDGFQILTVHHKSLTSIVWWFQGVNALAAHIRSVFDDAQTSQADQYV